MHRRRGPTDVARGSHGGGDVRGRCSRMRGAGHACEDVAATDNRSGEGWRAQPVTVREPGWKAG